MNKGYYYNKGFSAAYSRRIHFVKNPDKSWQKKAFEQGYRAGVLYLEAEALLNGFDCKWKYQEHLIKAQIK